MIFAAQSHHPKRVILQKSPNPFRVGGLNRRFTSVFGSDGFLVFHHQADQFRPAFHVKFGIDVFDVCLDGVLA
ncbi:hypothetical protein SDC9_191646 [bioreactor metagenome]|uniref:Uncharacterized protein n=1 Tax=bioreactor metagenome TaxID=1076179 RepID=A0A645HYG2_9ZZZZ